MAKKAREPMEEDRNQEEEEFWKENEKEKKCREDEDW